MRAVYASRSRDPRAGPHTLNQGLGPRVPFLWEPGGRLTLESGVAASSSDQSAKGTLYYTEHRHAYVPVYDGKRFAPWEIPVRPGTTARELALDLTGIGSGSNYDVFVAVDGGRPGLVLGPAWSSDSARAGDGGLERVGGRQVRARNHRQLWAGTIRGSASGQATDSQGKRFVWNAHNRLLRTLYLSDVTQHTYNTDAWRAWNATTVQFEWVQGAAEDEVVLWVAVYAWHTATEGQIFSYGLALDQAATSGPTTFPVTSSSGIANAARTPTSRQIARPAAGYHYAVYAQHGHGAAANTTWSQAYGHGEIFG